MARGFSYDELSEEKRGRRHKNKVVLEAEPHQIEDNKSLRVENDALKAENNIVKQRISQLDEKAVERVTTQLVYAKKELASAKSYNTTLISFC